MRRQTTPICRARESLPQAVRWFSPTKAIFDHAGSEARTRKTARCSWAQHSCAPRQSLSAVSRISRTTPPAKVSLFIARVHWSGDLFIAACLSMPRAQHFADWSDERDPVTVWLRRAKGACLHQDVIDTRAAVVNHQGGGFFSILLGIIACLLAV